MPRRPDYGIDSPAMIAAELSLSGVALAVATALFALRFPPLLGISLWVVSLVIGLYLLLMAAGMLIYSKGWKAHIRDRLLSAIPWRGDEAVLDVGCGRGLLLIGAARRLTTGRAIGIDAWVRGAVSGNKPEATLRNAALEGVPERVEVQDGDARHLPFADASFDVVVSNFVVHEMDTRADREQMLREIARVLRPGGHVGLVDFVFMDEAVRVLRAQGLRDAKRSPVGRLSFWTFTLLTLGLGRLYQVTGRKGM